MSAKRIDYAKQAKLLRKYGFKVNYRKGGSRQQKSAVSRAWRRIRNYVEGSKQPFRFFAATSQKKKKIRGVLSPIQVTPKGFFFRVPPNTKSFKLNLEGKDVVVVAEGLRGGKRVDRYIKLDPVEIAKDPAKAVADALKKAKAKRNTKGRIVVKGNDGKRAYDTQYFLNYAPELLRQLLDPERESPEDSGIANKRIGKNIRPLDPEEIADIFHLKLEFQSPSKHAKRRKKRTKRNR